MYPGKHAATDPQQPAFIMAQTGEPRHLRRARGAQQSAGPPAAGAGPAAARPLCHLHGEQPALPRSAAAPASAPASTTPASTRISPRKSWPTSSTTANRRCLITSAGQARRRDGRAARTARRSSFVSSSTADGRRRRACSNLDEATARLPGHADRRRVARHGDAVLLGHDRPAQGHLAAAAGCSRRRSSCRCSTS